MTPQKKNVAMRLPKRHVAPRAQAWVVMTEWSDTDDSPQLVFTVARSNRASGNRTSYAAVPIPNGWLFIEI
jgi:hypothetical protein